MPEDSRNHLVRIQGQTLLGDAFYTPPGHVPVKNAPGTEFLWFSPSEELRTAEAVMMKEHAGDAGRLNALA